MWDCNRSGYTPSYAGLAKVSEELPSEARSTRILRLEYNNHPLGHLAEVLGESRSSTATRWSTNWGTSAASYDSTEYRVPSTEYRVPITDVRAEG